MSVEAVHTLILLPLKYEWEFFTKSLSESVSAEPMSVGHRQGLFFPELSSFVAVGGHGKVEMAIRAQYLIDHCPALERVICCGAAGALDSTLKIGDLVIGDLSFEHDHYIRFVKRKKPQFLADPGLVKRLSQASSVKYEYHVGTIASGDEDIVDQERAIALQKESGALAVAWEGAGCARACLFNRVPFVELRAIGDQADAASGEEFLKNLPAGMRSLVAHLIQSEVF